MGSGVFRCILCEDIFTQKFALMNHMRSSHLGGDKEEDFVKEAQGETSEVQVKGKTIHKCAKCGERYRKLPTLKLHMREDHPDAGGNMDDQEQQEPAQQSDAHMLEIEKKGVGQENDEEVTVSVKDSEENPMEEIVNVEEFDSKGDNEDVEKGDGETLMQDFEDQNKLEAKCIVGSEEAQVELKVDPDTMGLEDKKGIMEERFVCDDCGKHFVHKRTLREHNIKMHPQKVPTQKFRGALDWVPYRTESECGKPKCVQCGKEFLNASNLKMHVRNVHIKLDRSLCIKCGKELSCTKSLTIHVRNVHLANKKYRGHSDWKPYRTESEDGKPKCKNCGKEYSTVKSLKDHVKFVHLKKEPRVRPQEPENERKCTVCERIFKYTINMKLHLVKHTQIFKNINFESKILKSEDRESATCLECGKWDKRVINIKQHIAQVHFQLHKVIDFNNRENFDFSLSGTGMKKPWSVAKKKEIKSGVFRCYMCENIFPQSLALMNHMESSH